MGVFKPPIGKVTIADATTLNGKTEDQLSVANADTLDGMDSTDFATIDDIPTENVVIFNSICNTPPDTYSGATYMVGISPSGDFAEFPFGTILRYNGDSWDVIGNSGELL